MVKIIDFKASLKSNELSDFESFLIETALDHQSSGFKPKGFCLITQSNSDVGGSCSSYSSIDDMRLEELESYIGKLSVELQRAVFKANCLKYSED